MFSVSFSNLADRFFLIYLPFLFSIDFSINVTTHFGNVYCNKDRS